MKSCCEKGEKVLTFGEFLFCEKHFLSAFIDFERYVCNCCLEKRDDCICVGNVTICLCCYLQIKKIKKNKSGKR